MAFVLFVVAVAGVFRDGPFHSSSAIFIGPGGAVIPRPIPPNFPGPLMGTVPNVIGESQAGRRGDERSVPDGATWIEKALSDGEAAGTVLGSGAQVAGSTVLLRWLVIIVSSGPTTTS